MFSANIICVSNPLLRSPSKMPVHTVGPFNNNEYNRSRVIDRRRRWSSILQNWPQIRKEHNKKECSSNLKTNLPTSSKKRPEGKNGKTILLNTTMISLCVIYVSISQANNSIELNDALSATLL